MQVIDEQNRKPIKMWTDGVPVEHEALNQLRNVASLPFIFKHVAVMPDVHWGIGATVGSVIATKGAIVPAAVGVDIGCGVAAVCTNLFASDLPDDLKSIRHSIEREIPVGFNKNRDTKHLQEEECRFLKDPKIIELLTTHKVKFDMEEEAKKLSSLGGGNHFLELCLDEDQQVWIMLHCGSRNIGNNIGKTFIELARKEMERFFINLPDKDLAYLPEGTKYFDDYVMAVEWAQRYAALNRKVMLRRTMRTLTHHFPQLVVDLENRVVNCHHNYVSREHHFGENIIVTRKGAVSAREGQLGIIPGSMGAKSYIVRGKGNPESFCSCSHGAGRQMSRNKAKDMFTVEDHERATSGVECRKDAGVLDETPGAYKDIAAVMAAQSDLVEIVHTLKQVICVKG